MTAELGWVSDIHSFWYGDRDVFAPDYEHLFDRWYRGGAEFDAEVRRRFEPLLREVADSGVGDWAATPRSCHVLVLLLDQLSRNMYRGSAQMFATDALAVELVHQCLGDGTYEALAPIEQLFMAVALEHSETLANVERSAALMKAIALEAPTPQRKRFASMRRYNADHLRVVKRFGRYPHRNRLLDRESTAEELEFLASKSYRWMRSVEPNS